MNKYIYILKHWLRGFVTSICCSKICQLRTDPCNQCQALPATMLAKNVETLKNMNAGTAKFAKWYARIVDPKVIPYTFHAQSKLVQAEKFECILVSKDPSQYMLGIVPFEFKEPNAAQEAYKKFKKSTVWEITTPAFDARAKPEYNGCPVKTVVLLTKPSTLKAVPPTNKAELDHPAQGLRVHLDIKGIMEILGKRSFVEGSGSAKLPTKTMDFIGKFIGISEQKDIEKGGKSHKVAAAEFVDTTGGKIVVSVWNAAYKLLQPLPVGVGVAIIGCNATKERDEVKLNIWPATHVSTDGEQAQSLTSLDTTGLATETLTATFTPGQDLAPLAEGEAHPTCAKALADAVGQAEPKVFQINRAMMDPPVQEELIYSKDGRPFIKSCRLRDRTGGADVDVVRGAVPALYGCADEADLKRQVEAQSLTSFKERVNVRGVIRVEAGVTKKYAVRVEKSPLEAVVSLSAMHQSLGLSTVSDDVVVSAPADRVLDEAMLGLALKRDAGDPLGAFRVLLLVQGTQESEMDTIDDKLPLQQQTFKMISSNARCLLSDSPIAVQLIAYCDFKKSLTYRLDRELALVLVSAVEHHGPGAASPGASGASASPGEAPEGKYITATVEHMEKISKDEKTALERAMTLEWKSVLTTISAQHDTPKRVSSSEQEYWTQPATKLRRLASEPASPKP